MTRDRQPFPLLQTAFNQSQAQVSPNGRWIAYTSDETGRSEVYVQSFPRASGVEGGWCAAALATRRQGSVLSRS
jgi:hypothetical protein